MRFRLLQAREPGDQVAEEERIAFARRLDVPEDAVVAHDLLSAPTSFASITDGVDAVLVGGSGDYSIYDDARWLPPFINALRDLADQQFPTFASCFGFQGLVVALGGTVRKDEDRAEVGTYEVVLADEARADPLFGALPPRFDAQLGHKDHAIDWPAAATNLAWSERCPYQALRVGRAVYATQFHPELTLEDNLLRLRRYRVQYTRAFGERGYQELLDGFRPSPHASALLRRFRALLEAGAF